MYPTANSEQRSFEPRKTLVIVALSNAPPYRVVEGKKVSGFYVDILEAVGEQLSWEIEYQVVPFARALRNMKLGRADVMLGPRRTPQREEYMDFSIPAFPPENIVIVYKNAANQVSSVGELGDKTIGVLRGSSYLEALDRDGRLSREEEKDYETLLRMLDRGHLDLVLIPELVSENLQRAMKLDFKRAELTMPGEVSYIAISRKSPLMAQIGNIQAALDAFKKTEAYEAMLLRYRTPK